MKRNEYALVTGGTSGMGLEYVKQLAGKGYNIIIAALPAREADQKTKRPAMPGPQEIAADMSKLHPELDFLPVAMDLAATDAAERLVDTIRQSRPDAFVEVLVNNAGLIHVKHFDAMSLNKISVCLTLHNLTLAKLCYLLMPVMKEKGRGYVLNISSLAAWLPFPFISTYSATKAFNRILTKALRTEYTGTGVKVATIYFGAVDTPLYNLSKGKRKLARCLGVMITPQKAVRKALRMLFSGRSGWMPGLVNKIAYVFCPLLPRHLVAWIDRTVSRKLNLD